MRGDLCMKKVAVEKGLRPIKDYLTNEGYEVQEFDNTKKRAKNFLNKYDAVVITGQDEDFLGIEDTITSIQPIIFAANIIVCPPFSGFLSNADTDTFLSDHKFHPNARFR